MTAELRGAQAGRTAGAAGDGPPADWLVDGGELGELIRSTDWSSSPFGARDLWPEALRTAVNIVVASRSPMCLLWGPELRLLYNDAYRDVAAGTHPSALGRPLRELWTELWPELAPAFAAVLERGESFVSEDRPFRFPRRGPAEARYFTLSCSPVYGERGAVGGVLTLLQETTAAVETYRRTEAELRLLSEIAAHIPEGINVVSVKDLTILYANATMEEMFGYQPGELIGRHVSILNAPGDSARVTSQIEKTLRERGHFHGDLLTIKKDGTPFWSRITVSSMHHPRYGEVYVSVQADITERKRSEQALVELESSLRRAQAMSHVGSWTLDPATHEMTASDELLRILELEPDEVRLDVFASIIHPEDLERAMQTLRLGTELGQPYEIEHRLLLRSGAIKWVDTIGSPAVDGAGRVVKLYGTTQDVTARKRAEEALRDADRRKTEFLAMLSHELRNPLAPIRNSLYILDRAAPGGEQAGRAQAIIDRQVAHLTRLVDDLLDVTRITRGKIELKREVLELNELVRRTVEDHRGAYVAGGLALQLDLAPVEIRIDGDSTRLAQAIGNLLQNAAKFTRRGGSVTVALEVDAPRAQAVLTVRDTGAGIAPDMMPRLFAPFAQADRTLERSQGGLGLGLALVKGLVELHGGSVSAASEGVGKGAEFTIRLPLEGTAVAASREESPGLRAGSPRRVLVIEDNVDAADSLRELLELNGHIAVVAFDGRAGMERARALRPDVILCDIGLPGMDGYAVARALRADPELGRVTLVALTGYAGPEDVAKAAEAGFDAHIAKPPSVEALERVLATGGARWK